MNIKHNKIKNTGILFELLVRKVASDVLDGKSDSFAVKIMREHFHSKSELGKELQLYRSFFNTQVLSEVKAFNMLDLILEKRKTLNEKLLNTQKFLLIKEIKDHCDLKQFMSGRVASYKIHASIYKLFESLKLESGNISELNEVVSSKFAIIEHLQGFYKEENIIKESEYTQIIKQQPEEIRHLSYKFLLENFNNTYNVLNNNQKLLLREYINNGIDDVKLKKFISTESIKIVTSLKQHVNKIKNEVTRIKINEVISQLHKISTHAAVKQNYMTALLIGYQISEELESLS